MKRSKSKGCTENRGPAQVLWEGKKKSKRLRTLPEKKEKAQESLESVRPREERTLRKGLTV